MTALTYNNMISINMKDKIKIMVNLEFTDENGEKYQKFKNFTDANHASMWIEANTMTEKQLKEREGKLINAF